MAIESGRNRPYGLLGVLAAGSLLALWVLLWSTSFGIGVEPDSAVYISAARSVVRGEGFAVQGEPLTHFPIG